MTLRIGDLAQSSRLTATMLGVQGRLREAQAAVSSGKAAASFDQIADRAAELLRVRDTRTVRSALAAQNDRLGQELQVADGAMAAVIDVADRARVALVQRLDGGLGDEVQLDAEIDSLLAEVEDSLNTRFNGRYLFGGTRTDAAPVSLPSPPPTTADPTAYYRGDQVRLTARADLGVEVTYGVTADAAPFAALIGALGQARDAHLNDDRAGLAAASSAMETALGGLTDLRAQVGIAAERLESIAEGQRTTVLYLDEVTSSIEDVDLAAVMTRIASDQASLEAAYTITGRLAALSLADYLR
ncbi:MAG: flagellin [Geminicoccaceae bacterium]